MLAITRFRRPSPPAKRRNRMCPGGTSRADTGASTAAAASGSALVVAVAAGSTSPAIAGLACAIAAIASALLTASLTIFEPAVAAETVDGDASRIAAATYATSYDGGELPRGAVGQPRAWRVRCTTSACGEWRYWRSVSYTHLRAHETPEI